MRSAVAVAVLALVLASCAGDSVHVVEKPYQVSNCEGHEPVLHQESANNYSSPAFTGQTWCADGRHEWFENGFLVKYEDGTAAGDWES